MRAEEGLSDGVMSEGTTKLATRNCLQRSFCMAQVELNSVSPDFTLDDYQGNAVTLSQFKGDKNVLLVFNRGFF